MAYRDTRSGTRKSGFLTAPRLVSSDWAVLGQKRNPPTASTTAFRAVPFSGRSVFPRNSSPPYGAFRRGQRAFFLAAIPEWVFPLKGGRGAPSLIPRLTFLSGDFMVGRKTPFRRFRETASEGVNCPIPFLEFNSSFGPLPPFSSGPVITLLPPRTLFL